MIARAGGVQSDGSFIRMPWAIASLGTNPQHDLS